jgi:two-component system OmpR family sensor kinase
VTTLAGRLVALAGVVALASVLITGVALAGLFRQGGTEAAAAALARDADTIAAMFVQLSERNARAQRIGTGALQRQLKRREIEHATVGPGATARAASLPAPFTAADVTQVRETGSVTARRRAGGAEWLVAGRDADGTAVLLAQPLDVAVAGLETPRWRIALPLVLGLTGGAVAGLVLARQLGRPLAGVAGAARRLSAGDREVRVPPEGPAEVADVATALNSLAEALATSEERQRRFLLDVSHELRTPLTAVSGYAEALADGVITGAEVPPAAGVIRDEAARLRGRVEDLLALARMSADDFRLEWADADLVELVRGVHRAWLPRAAAAGVDFSAVEPGSPVVVRTDAERVRQAVDALVDNALRVLPAGAPLVVACSRTAGGACVQVRDGGPGLAPEDLAVAFERGRLTERYRGDRPVGSGLGLALVGELARRLNGRAEATPAPEGGVCFTVHLPTHTPAPPATQAPHSPNGPPRAG